MPLTTVNVTVVAYDQNGHTMANARVTAKLSGPDVSSQGHILPEELKAVTNTNGVAVLALWPNELGSTQTYYDISITNPDTGKKQKLTATIPNAHCTLRDVADLPPYPGKTDGQLATDAAVAAVAPAVSARIAAENAAAAAAASAGAAQASAAAANVTGAAIITAPSDSAYYLLVDGGVAKRITIQSLAAILAPYFDGVTPINPGNLDGATFTEYKAAINAATSGGKRLAGANAIISALSPAHRLRVFRDASVIIDAAYSGNLVATNDGTNVVISLGTLTGATVANGDIDTGTWTFEVQGGANYARKLSGTVGKTGSDADLILSGDTAVGDGINPTVSFIVPRSVDGL